MAERRMFTKRVTDDDNFMELSASAQALYLHLSMSADDDGFCNQVSISMFKAHASVADLQQLLEKRYIYQFENGVIVIKHWRMANALRKDRYTPTNFREELARLKIKPDGAYTFDNGCQSVATWLPNGCQSVAVLDTQDSIGKDSIGKYNIYIGEVVDFLNALCGTNYRKNSAKTQSVIKARLNEGYTIDDFKTVISKKAKEWKGTEMEKYLRPETLFGTKFESYLNAKIIKKEELQAAIGGQKIERRDYDADQLQGLFTDLGDD